MKKNKDYNIIEKFAIYLAEESIGKSVPIFCYKVKKPQNIEKIIKEVWEKVDTEK